jgi:hypothetical protein
MTELIALHPEVSRVMRQFEALELHAARSGREVMHLLAQVASDSRAQTVRELADEIETVIGALLMVMPAYAPPLNVMHAVMSRVEDALAAGTDVVHLREIISADAAVRHLVVHGAGVEIARFGAELVPERFGYIHFYAQRDRLADSAQGPCQNAIFGCSSPKPDPTAMAWLRQQNWTS